MLSVQTLIEAKVPQFPWASVSRQQLFLEVASYLTPHLYLSLVFPSPHPGVSPLPPDPLAVSIVTQCDTLVALVRELEERGGREGPDLELQEVQNWIAPGTRQFLASWLLGSQVVRNDVNPIRFPSMSQKRFEGVLSFRGVRDSCI